MSGVLAANLAALTSLSPSASTWLEAVAPGAGLTTIVAASGDPVLEWDGRVLDSRRDPREAARAAAAGISADSLVLLGFGSGYLAEALDAAGVRIGAVVDCAQVLAAALACRDLRHLLARVPVIPLESLQDAASVAQLRARSPHVSIHAPSALCTPGLAALAARWQDLRPARPPRVLVAGPIDGGSLGVAVAVTRAMQRAGAEVTFVDASQFAAGKQAFEHLPVDPATKRALHGHHALLLGDAVVEVAREVRPDLVVALAQAPLTAPALDRLRALGSPVAFWFVENTRVLPYWRDVVRHYDLVYAIQDGPVLEQLRSHGAARVEYLPMACDPELHHAVSLTADEHHRYGSPLSFAGAPYLNRRHVLAAVRDLGLTLWGDGWDATTLAGHVRVPGRFDRETMLKVFSGSAVNINLHSAEHVTGLDPLPDYVNPRTFELAACGAFQLVDARSPLASLFAADELAVFHDPGELRRLAEHYIQRPDERAAMSRRAQQRVLAEHAYGHRVMRICRDTLPAHLRPDAATRPVESLADALARAAMSAELTAEEACLRVVDAIAEAGAPR